MVNHGTTGIRQGRSLLVLTALLCSLALSVTANAAPPTYYVDVNWTGTKSGTSTEPYDTISAAVAAVNAGSGGDFIVIADGTYDNSKETFGAEGITITNGVTIMGGYVGWVSGTTFDWSTRVPRSTVIDLTGAGTRAFYIDYLKTGFQAITFDGLTIQNANHAKYGGAIGRNTNGWDGAYSVLNCLFSNNVTTADAGAVYLYGRSQDSRIDGCDFYGNSCGLSGGAVYYNQAGQSHTMTNCLFVANHSGNEGGAV
jgi:hypothetical protein